MATLHSRVPLGHVVYLDCLVYLELKEIVGQRVPSDSADCLDLKVVPGIQENRGITESRECLEFRARRARQETEVWWE